MKLCIISEFTCDFGTYEEMIESNREQVMQFCSEMTLAKVNDHKCILVADVTDPSGLNAHMSTPEMRQWDQDNGCIDMVFLMKPAAA